ncbi:MULTISPECIES: hypothetical protein [Bacillaceae]|uniref:Uncharacterized protein n=2 Tax=Bacillaceae TaxID=186817 RepID=A0A856M695_9BACI|nr:MULTISPECIES: hypothetical protein [Bacillaceae]AMK74783.1 hypothetical protein AWV81_22055 [Bacillus subtilis subsp. natto]API45210.1 hypothetical protein BSR08_22740 [Bacillus subtilis]API98545.1 hypothetical protein BKP58_22350 [Bacillus subtilis]ASB72307.1 hypothetical protein S100333_04448 [Bacillus subtilis subsp. subtilis]AVL07021.1 hypothetical protein BS21228_22245 [Bacillus subtilis]
MDLNKGIEELQSENSLKGVLLEGRLEFKKFLKKNNHLDIKDIHWQAIQHNSWIEHYFFVKYTEKNGELKV